jgi:hypothetical protein
MMRGLMCALALTWAAAALTVLPVGQAMAAQETGDPGSKPKPEAKKAATSSKTKKAAQAPQAGGSAESPADRSARLKRECRGAVNAGACTGYTQ